MVAGFGQNLLFTMVGTFLLVFLVQYDGLSVAGIAAVTAITGFARITDAIADPLVGSLVDLTSTRWGRLRPFVLFAAGPIALSTTLMFWSPPLPEVGRVVWFGVIYVLWSFIYTSGDVPFWALTASVFREPDARARAISAVRALQTVALGLASLGLPWLALGLSFGRETTSAGWTLSALLVSVVGMAMFTLAFFGTREQESTAPRPRLRGVLSSLVTNRALVVVLVASALGFGRFMVQAGGATFTLVAYDNAGDFTIIGAAIIVGMLAATLATPRLLRVVSARTAVVASSFASALVSLGMFFGGYQNLWVLCAFILVNGATLGVFLVAQVALIAAAVDDAERRTGVRNDGIAFGSGTFVSKVMSGLALLAFGAFLVAAGYHADVHVTDGMRQTVFTGLTLVPAVSALLSGFAFLWYPFPGRKA